MSDEEDEYVIRNLAYELWEAAGRPPGKHLDFWNQAIRQMKRQGETSEMEEGTSTPLGASRDPNRTV